MTTSAASARLAGRSAATLALLPIGLVAVLASAANVVEASNPALALELWPFNQGARARLAGDALTQGDPSAYGEIETMARTIAVAEPINPVAYRLLGTVAGARDRSSFADAALAHTQRLTRRDPLSQLYFIERAVQRGDAPEAFSHYAVALDTNRETMPTLFPILVKAAASPELRTSYAEFLTQGGAWREQLAFKIASETQPVAAALALLEAARQRGLPLSDTVRQPLIERLIAAGDERAARRLALRDSRQADALLLNPGFGRVAALDPYDWSFADSSSATLTPNPAGGLDFVLEATTNPWLARQRLTLAPGAYRFRSRIAIDSGSPGGLQWSVACVDGRTLATLPATTQVDASIGFTVPADCPAQWVAFGPSDRQGSAQVSGTINSVSLERVGKAG